jgi:hypothetical protein
MNESKDYPYKTHLNVYYQPLELVNVAELVAACTDHQWYNQTLCQVNDSVIRLVHNFVNNYTKFFDRNRGRQESCHNPIFYHIITYREEAYELPEKAPYYSH